jgi:hypothetical protein
MAHKITTEAVDAFMSGNSFNKSNTSVEIRSFKDEPRTSAVLKLHGNVIARRSLDGRVLEVCDGNWQTRTTKERLNGIPGVCVYQIKGQWFLNGNEWSGDWTAI